MKMKIAGVMASLVLLAGCGGASMTTNSSGGIPDNVWKSGFLSNYAQLQAVPGVDGTYRYINNSANFAQYKKIMIEPVMVVLAPNPEYNGLQPDAMQRITGLFRTTFQDAIGQRYQIVDKPGPDVMHIRLAISGIQPTRLPLGVTDFIPVKALFNVARSAAGETPQLAEISAEFEVLSSNSLLLASGVSTRKSEKNIPQGEMIDWQDVKPMVSAWAQGFVKQLEALRSQTGK